MNYLVGDTARLSVVWTLDGVPTDTSSVLVEIGSADTAPVTRTLAAGEVVHDGPGTYSYDFVVPAPGTFTVNWHAGGVVNAYDSYEIDCFPLPVPWSPGGPRPPLASLSQFRDRLRSDPGDPATPLSSYELLTFLRAASTEFELDTGRTFWSGADDEVRFYGSADGQELVIDDTTLLSEVAVDTAGDGTYSTLVTAGQFIATPVEAPARGFPYERIRLGRNAPIGSFPQTPLAVRVTGRFGFNRVQQVPELVQTAVLLKAHRLYSRKESPTGVVTIFDGQIGQGSQINIRADADYNDIVALYKRAAPEIDQPAVTPLRPAAFRLAHGKPGLRWWA